MTQLREREIRLRDFESITKDDIRDERNRVKIGDPVMYKSELGQRSGRIVGKYSTYCVVEDRAGFRETILWVDLVKRNREGLRGNETD